MQTPQHFFIDRLENCFFVQSNIKGDRGKVREVLLAC